MVYGLQFLALSLGLLVLAGQAAPDPRAILLGLAGLGLLGPALAWLARQPAVFGKRPEDGQVPLWALLLHAAWYLLAGLGLLAQRLGREAPRDEVAPRVWVGRRPTRREAARLPPDVVVLDMTAELPGTAAGTGRPYRCLPVLDTQAPSPAQLDDAVAWIGDHWRAGRSVLIHCAAGHGRSATAAAAWLLDQTPGLSIEDAEARLRAARPGIRLNAAQRQALQRWCRSA